MESLRAERIACTRPCDEDRLVDGAAVDAWKEVGVEVLLGVAHKSTEETRTVLRLSSEWSNPPVIVR